MHKTSSIAKSSRKTGNATRSAIKLVARSGQTAGEGRTTYETEATDERHPLEKLLFTRNAKLPSKNRQNTGEIARGDGSNSSEITTYSGDGSRIRQSTASLINGWNKFSQSSAPGGASSGGGGGGGSYGSTGGTGVSSSGGSVVGNLSKGRNGAAAGGAEASNSALKTNSFQRQDQGGSHDLSKLGLGGNSNLGSGRRGGGSGDPYASVQKAFLTGEKPTGTGERLENLREKMSPEDKELYDKLDAITNVYRNDSVGFDSDLRNASKAREASPEHRDQTLAFLVDSIKKESPEVQEAVLKNGTMNIFLSDKLSFGNKEVGGFVSTGKGSGSNMALPLDLSDYGHADIARHEGVHWKDVASDGVLDGLVAGEDDEIQDLMITLMRKFNNEEYDKDAIAKLDITNLKYGSGYTAKMDREGKGRALNPGDEHGINESFALGEARAVLEQEFADKPEAFKAAGKEFAALAAHWEDNVAKYDDSNVIKDGYEDKTAVA